MRLYIYLLLGFLTALSLTAQAQKGFYIKRLSAGYRISEIDAIGTNPFTISPLLKNPTAYNQFLSDFIYNGYGSSPGPQTIHTFYLNAELYKNRRYGFWKHAYLQTGLFITNPLPTTAGFMEHQYLKDSTTYTYSNTYYSLKHNTQFLGINLGINRNTKLARRFYSTIGLQVQGSVAFRQYYEPVLDSSFLTLGGADAVWKTVYSKQLPTLPGKHYFQWQIMLPLGLEYEVWRNKITVRAEVAPGYVRSRYRDKSFAAGEAHSAGLWLIYKL